MAQIPKIVEQRLQAVANSASHPDPNQLGAFAEKSLPKREQAEVLQHLSQCTNCRDILSLSMTQPAVAGAVSRVPVSLPWFSLPVLRWGAALACVLVVGAVVMMHRRPESRTGAIAGGQAVARLQPPAPNVAIEKKAASLQANVASIPAAAVSQNPISAKPAKRNHAPANSQPIEMAEAEPASPFAEIVPGRAKDAIAEWQGAEAQQAMGGPLATHRNMMTPVPSEAFPENLIPRWTLSSDGTLQRSLDSGATWQTIPVSSQTIFRALSANGLDIWVGGTAGSLFHSSDAGQHWTQVLPVVNGQALTDDIIGVEFRDALHGKLTSSIEEIWITSDAGQTWQKQ